MIPHVNVFAYRYPGVLIRDLFFREGAEFVDRRANLLRNVRAETFEHL